MCWKSPSSAGFTVRAFGASTWRSAATSCARGPFSFFAAFFALASTFAPAARSCSTTLRDFSGRERYASITKPIGEKPSNMTFTSAPRAMRRSTMSA